MSTHAAQFEGICVIGKSSGKTLSFIAEILHISKKADITLTQVSVKEESKEVSFRIVEDPEFPDDLTSFAVMKATTADKVYQAISSNEKNIVEKEVPEDLVIETMINSTVRVQPSTEFGKHTSISVVRDELRLLKKEPAHSNDTWNILIKCEVNSQLALKEYNDRILLARKLVSSVKRCTYDQLHHILEGKVTNVVPVADLPVKFRLGVTIGTNDHSARVIQIFI